ncbi:MAG: PglZ domain-containing protein [Anaerolineales bacterium]|nr:PglZ domain-containing protein [Anaerolineales bacterium]
MASTLPKTVTEFVGQKLTALPAAARLAIVCDPYGDLGLGETFEVEGRVWRVTRYDGNDLAFRQAYRPGERDLVWLTCPPDWSREVLPRIELRSLMDIWRRADAFIDASLPGVLGQLAHRELWPAESVWAHGAILGQNLPAVVTGVEALHPHLVHGAALDAHAVRALALHCLQPGQPVQGFLFRHDSPAALLDAYTGLLWQVEWDGPGMALLQLQARAASHLELGAAAAWLEVEPESLALYLYLRRWLSRQRVRAIANQLRGLGLLSFDPEELEPWAESVLCHWDGDSEWRRQVISRAEERLQQDDMDRIVNLLDLSAPEDVFGALVQSETPAAVLALGAQAFIVAAEHRRLGELTSLWVQRRPTALSEMPQTPFTQHAQALAAVFDELGLINERVAEPLPVQANLARLLDWYVARGIFDLEYACARAEQQLQRLKVEALRQTIQRYLHVLRGRVREYLNRADQALADAIISDWRGYLAHPRLSTNLLRDLVKKRRLSPTAEACLWIVVFDGMRWDTWARHVRPRLLERFELAAQEGAYLSLLPSWTSVARTGLLAGRLPGAWRSYEGNATRDQEQLVARLFELPQRERSRLLQFFSGMESDLRYSQISSDQRSPYNVLIYNLSDDNLHSVRGNLVALNAAVDGLLDDIMQVLDNLVRPGDTVIVSSDHGFAELHEGDAAIIPDDSRWQRYQDGGEHPVRYRYATTHDLPADLAGVHRFEYAGTSYRFTVAVGGRWFKRAGWRGPLDRYAHGGLSFAEMAVPGAVLRPIVERKLELALQMEPDTLHLVESEDGAVTVRVTNRGNVRVSGHLEVRAEVGGESVSYSIDLGPAEQHEHRHSVHAIYRRRSDGTVETISRVSAVLHYTDPAGQARTQRRAVAVEVQPRPDVVEIDFGGLDDLEI